MAKWVAIGVGGPIVLGIVVLLVALHSEAVTRWALHKVTAGSESYAIARVHGTLGGPLELAGVQVRTSSADVTIDSLVMNWSPLGLIGGDVRLDSLHIIGMHVVSPGTAPPTPGPSTRPSLPIGVVLRDVRVDGISVVAPAGVRVENGTARLAGRATDYRLSASAGLSLPQFSTYPRLDTLAVSLIGTGDLVHLQLSPAAVPLLDGSLGARGDLTWWPLVSWNLALTADSIRPGLLAAQPSRWPGVLAARGGIVGYHDSTGTYARLALDTVRGRLRGEPVGAAGLIRVAGSTPDSNTALRVPAFSAKWGSARLEASGYSGDTLAVQYHLIAPHLATFAPAAAGSLSARGTVSGPRATPEVVATVQGSGIRYGANSVARLKGQVDVAMAPDGTLDVTLHGRHAEVGTTVLDSVLLAIRGTRSTHRIDLRAGGPAATARLAATGGLDSSGTRWAGRLDTLRIQGSPLGSWHLTTRPALAVGGSGGHLDQLCLVSSDTTSSRLCARGSWSSAYDWVVAAHLDSLPLAIVDSLIPDSLLGVREALTGDLTADLQGRATGGRVAGNAELRTVGGAFVYPSAGGDTTMRQVVFDTAQLQLQAGAAGLKGTLALRFVARDRSPVGHLAATFAVPTYHDLHQSLAAQPTHVRLDGAVDNLSVSEAFISAGLDSLTGRMRFAGALDGRMKSPAVRGELHLDQVAAWLGEQRAARGSLDAQVAGRVTAHRAVAGSLTVVPRGVVYEYPLAGVPQQLVVDSGGLQVTAGDSGVFGALALGLGDSNGTRLGDLRARLALPGYTRLGTPLARQPITASFHADLQHLRVLEALTSQFDSLSGRLALALTVDSTIGTPTVGGTLDVTDLAAVLPQGARITGGITGRLHAHVARDSSITGSLRLTPQNIVIGGADTSAGQPLVAMADTGLTATIGPAGTHALLDLQFATAQAGAIGGITGRADLPRYSRLGQRITGQPLDASVSGGIADLGFLSGFTQQVDSLTGSARIGFRAAGAVGHLHPTGSLTLDTVTAHLPLLGVTYRDLQFAARVDSAGAIAMHGNVRSGPGSLQLTGTTRLQPTTGQPGRIHIEGKQFEAINTDKVHAIVTPSIDVAVAGDSINATGTVHLPLVAVHLDEMPQSAIPPSQDVVFVGDTTTAGGPNGWKIVSRIQVVLGDSVAFQGFNFTAEMAGRLLLMQSPGNPPTASGGVVIQHGQYKAYGQDLTITNGHLRWAGGPVSDPTLDLEAARTAQDSVVAGLQITGTLQDPQVQIFSNPAMPEDRALAYIVLGHAPGESSGGNGTLVNKAVNALGLRGSNYLAKTVGGALGLSNAHIETNGSGGLQQASFVAGTYLAPNLYVSYGIGLFDPISTLRLRYDISKHWSLEAERGVSSSADVLYRTERGDLGTPEPAPSPP